MSAWIPPNTWARPAVVAIRPSTARRAAATQDVVEIFGRSGRVLSPTHFGSLPAFLARNPQLLEDPRLDLYPRWAQATVREAGTGPQRVPAPTRDGGSSRAIRDVFAAGGRIVAGTDTAIAVNLHAEIASYVDAGLTPYQALRTATAVPADVLGLDAGTLEPGKLADIAPVRGNPLEDIASTARVEKVVANGRLYDVDELLRAGPSSRR